MNAERIGAVLVCRAGKGEWYNQPHDRRWDMGEDVEDIPPAQWHLYVQRVIEAQDSPPELVVIDVSGMDWLVGQDLGFLITLSKHVAPRGIDLAVVASERVVGAVRILPLDDYFRIRSSIDDLLRDS